MDLNLLDRIIKKLRNKKNMIIIQDIKQPDDKVAYVDNKNIRSEDGILDINFYRLNDMKGRIGFAILDNVSDEYYLYNEKINKQRKTFKREIEISSTNDDEIFNIKFAVSEENSEFILLLYSKCKEQYEGIEYEIELDKEVDICDTINVLDKNIKINEIISNYYVQSYGEENDDELSEFMNSDEQIDDFFEENEEDNVEENADIANLNKLDVYVQYIQQAKEIKECIEQINEYLNEKDKANEMIQNLEEIIYEADSIDEYDEQLDRKICDLAEIITNYENYMEDFSTEIDEKLYSNYSVKHYKKGKEIDRNIEEDNYTIQDYYSMAVFENSNTKDVFRKVSKLTKYINQIIKQIKENSSRDER